MPNQHFLKVSDKFPIESALELDHDYQIASVVTIEKQEKKSDGEGGFDYTHKAKFTSHITLIKDGETLRGKDPQRLSQQVRKALWIKGVEYDEMMYWILTKKLDELVEEFNRERV